MSGLGSAAARMRGQASRAVGRKTLRHSRIPAQANVRRDDADDREGTRYSDPVSNHRLIKWAIRAPMPATIPRIRMFPACRATARRA